MGRLAVTGGLLSLLALPLPAAYSNLIATADGTAVYFQARTSLDATSWFRLTAGGQVEAVSDPVADISAAGTVLAYAAFAERFCSTPGSTCFVQPDCAARYGIRGEGIATSGIRQRTFVRLDRNGSVAWLDQDRACPGLGQPAPAPLNGLYDTATMRRMAPANGGKLASVRYGRRLITASGRALVFYGLQLTWLDAAGAVPLRHVNGAFEAVTDAAGDSVVYVEAAVGKLHWIFLGIDYELGLRGSAPALSDDGNTLYYLDPKGALMRYDAVTNVVARLGRDRYREFALAANAVFAVTGNNRIVRWDLTSSAAVEWLPALPQVESYDAPQLPSFFFCAIYCYPEFTPQGMTLTPGGRVTLFGRNLAGAGWRVLVAGVDAPLEAVSPKEAWFQTPVELPVGNGVQTVELYHPTHPLRFRIPAQVSPR